MIEHSKVKYNKDVLKAVKNVLKSGYVLEGVKTKEFEDQMCKYIGIKHAVAATSGTLSIVIALKALGISKGDKVATSTYICRTVVDAIKMIGAEPFICDINYEDYSIDYKFGEDHFDSSVKCIIIPNMFGIPADIKKFSRFNIPIIEDCAQSLGSEYNSIKCGSFGDVSILSFQATKMLTTGEGGIMLTNNDEIHEKIRYYKTHANLKKSFAYNFNYTDIQSAIGIEQLKYIDNYIKIRKTISTKYSSVFCSINQITLPYEYFNRKINYFRYIIKVKNKLIRNSLIEKAYENGIKLKLPIAPAPIHNLIGLSKDVYKNCEDVFNTSVSIPNHQYLRNKEIDLVISFINNFFY